MFLLFIKWNCSFCTVIVTGSSSTSLHLHCECNLFAKKEAKHAITKETKNNIVIVNSFGHDNGAGNYCDSLVMYFYIFAHAIVLA